MPTPALSFVLAGVRFFWNGVLLLFANAVIIALLIALFISVFPWARKMSLKQDSWAANALERENLLHLSEKIDGLKLPNVENSKRRKGWIAWIWPMPNMTEGVNSLAPRT